MSRSSPRGRWVLVNAYSHRNVGDAAIVLATDKLVIDNKYGHLISSSRYWEQDRTFYAERGIDTLPPVIPFAVREAGSSPARVLGLLAGLVTAYGLTLALRGRPRRLARAARRMRLPGLAAVAESEGVVLCGGGYLYSSRSAVNLTLAHHVLTTHLASLAAPRVVMIPQSVGPLRTGFARRLVRLALSRLPTIVVREQISYEELASVDPKAQQRAVVCPDIALYGFAAGADDVLVDANVPTAILVAMDWTWAREGAGESDLTSYIDKLATVAQRLEAAGLDVIVTGHSGLPEQNQDDMAIAARVAHRARELGCTSARSETLGATPESMRGAFQAARVVVGTRLHACLVGLEAGTPAIGLAYQPKTAGTYELLGLSHLARDVMSFEPEDVAALAARCATDDETRAQVADTVASARADLSNALSALLAS
jgi:colanic acid/amylovoran biosynthesis protein